jgi:hypothetical protein
VCRREIWIEVERALEFFHSSISVPPGNGNIAEREVCPRIAVVKLGRSFGERRACFPSASSLFQPVSCDSRSMNASMLCAGP